MTGETRELAGLSAEFPDYEFTTQQTWSGLAIIARRHGGGTRSGLYAVITDNPEEMRRELREDQHCSGDSQATAAS